MTRSLLILGGSGFLGRALCEQLSRRFGAEVRITVPTRRPAHAQALQTLPAVTVVAAQAFDDLARLVPSHDAVINLIAILQGRPADFERVHAELPRRLAAHAGAARVIHVSALGVAADAPSHYLRSKAAGEAALAAVGATLLRPSIIFGREDRSVNLFARLQALAPVMPLAGATARVQPGWVQDVARALVACVEHPETRGRVFEAAGPEVMSLAELVRRAGRAAGHPRPVWPLPAPLAWLQAVAMEALPGEPLLSRDNLASLRVPNVASGDHPGLAELGIQAAALDTVLPTYLGRDHDAARLDDWRTRAGR